MLQLVLLLTQLRDISLTLWVSVGVRVNAKEAAVALANLVSCSIQDIIITSVRGH
jgi:hypothetical protein